MLRRRASCSSPLGAIMLFNYLQLKGPFPLPTEHENRSYRNIPCIINRNGVFTARKIAPNISPSIQKSFLAIWISITVAFHPSTLDN